MSQTASSEGGPVRAPKLTGRAFYESIGSPKMIVAPMVDRSEFAWRLLTRSYLDEERSKSLLAYTPMLHARLFTETPKFREQHFQATRAGLATKEKAAAPAWLDGNPQIDRPLFVQFCANKPDELLDAAEYVAPYCDAVDLNLGCPQGIAKAGRYGAFLQEDWDTIYKLINKLHNELSVPVTAKMRILETREKTLEYAKMILSAGASILTVHGRRREQKGHNTGVADWTMIRYLRDSLPPDTVIFANGNILNSDDLEACLAATGADGIMSAEGNLSDPTIFAKPPVVPNPREYWYGTEKDNRAGYRIDAVFRRYLDIIHRYSLNQEPPERGPLYIATDAQKPEFSHRIPHTEPSASHERQKKAKKQKGGNSLPVCVDPNLKFMQGHLFQLLRPILSIHTDIRDTLAKTTVGDIDSFERILAMVERATVEGIDGHCSSQEQKHPSSPSDVTILQSQAGHSPVLASPDADQSCSPLSSDPDVRSKAEKGAHFQDELSATEKVIAQYRRPWWVCQPHIRPLPEDAIRIGALTLKKVKANVKVGPTIAGSSQVETTAMRETEHDTRIDDKAIQRSDDSLGSQREADGKGQSQTCPTFDLNGDSASQELPKAALVCG